MDSYIMSVIIGGDPFNIQFQFYFILNNIATVYFYFNLI